MRMKHSLLNMLVTTIPNLILPVMGIIKFSLFSSIYGGSINGLYSTMMQLIWDCLSTDALSTFSKER